MRLTIINVWILVLFILFSNVALAQPDLLHWQSRDIGGPSKAGAIIVSQKGVLVKGSGDDVWGNSDKFHYYSGTYQGDHSIVTFIQDFDAIDEWAKAGIMIRESDSTDSRHIFLFARPDKTIALGCRSSKGGLSKLLGPIIYPDSSWLKLQRFGDSFSAFYSRDGIQWSFLSSIKIQLPSKLYYGLAVTSHVDSLYAKARFSNLKVTENTSISRPIEPVLLDGFKTDNGEIMISWEDNNLNILGYNLLFQGQKINKYLIYENYFHFVEKDSGLIALESIDRQGRIVQQDSLNTANLDRLSLEWDQQVPNQNPVAQNYIQTNLWTAQMKWENTINVFDKTGLVNTNMMVDSLKLSAVIDSLAESGGGVIFFPPGKYLFDFDIVLKSGVIIRGSDPVVVGCNNTLYYSTQFEFPKFQESEKGNISFRTQKKIVVDTTVSAKNFGLVNLDLNRARIEFNASNYHLQDGIYTPLRLNRNVLIWGVRQNNIAIPDPGIPTQIMIDENRGWQRWPLHFGTNVNIFVDKNCLVGRCVFNDRVMDDFLQPDYLTDGFYMLKGEEAKFRFLNNEVISINSNLHKIRYTLENEINRYDFFEVWSRGQSFLPSEGVNIVENVVYHKEFEGAMPIRSNGYIKSNKVFTHNVKEYLTYDGRVSKQNDWKNVALSDTIFLKYTHVDQNGNKLPYRLMEPIVEKKGFKKGFPIIVYLHGIWEAGNDNISQLRHSVTLLAKKNTRESFPCYVLCPQHPADISFFGPEGPEWPMRSTLEIVDELIESGKVNKDKVYLFGISSGGNATFQAITHNPNKFAAAFTLGSLPSGLDSEQLKKFRKTNLWLFYGEKDQFCPKSYIKYFNYMLEKEGVDAKVTIYPNTGHGIFVKVLEEPNLLPWLFESSR